MTESAWAAFGLVYVAPLEVGMGLRLKGTKTNPMEQTTDPPNDKKTVLIVDDEPEILAVVSALLGDAYTILTAGNGTQGLQQSRETKGSIHLLLSDFQMPGMSGVELATAMTLDRPELKVLLMSGFPGGMLVLNEGWHFLAKPFIASQLRALVSGLVSPGNKSKSST
jgi:DNA-binding NtrC family response regulator